MHAHACKRRLLACRERYDCAQRVALQHRLLHVPHVLQLRAFEFEGRTQRGFIRLHPALASGMYAGVQAGGRLLHDQLAPTAPPLTCPPKQTCLHLQQGVL